MYINLKAKQRHSKHVYNILYVYLQTEVITSAVGILEWLPVMLSIGEVPYI